MELQKIRKHLRYLIKRLPRKQSVIKKVNQNKLADNTKKKNLKSAPLSVPKGKVEASTFVCILG